MNEIRSTLNVKRKVALSVAVVLQIWAVIAEPIRFSTRGPGGPSPAASSFRAPIGAYSDFAYLNHGYAFFAPDPGPSHLVRASWQVDGNRESLTFPDREEQWPRLLYHRHFMLSEFLHNLHEPSRLPPEIPRDSEVYRMWRSSRDRYEMVRDAFVHHLESETGVRGIQIERVEHRMPGIPEYVGDGVGLRDERLYRILPDGIPDIETVR